MKIKRIHQLIFVSIFILLIVITLIGIKTYNTDAKDIIAKKMDNNTISTEIENKYKVTMENYSDGEIVKDTRSTNGNVCVQFQLKEGQYYRLYYGYQSGENNSFGITGDTTTGCSTGLCRNKTECTDPNNDSTCKNENFMRITEQGYDTTAPDKRLGWAYTDCNENGQSCAVPNNTSLREVCISNLDTSKDIDFFITIQGFKDNAAQVPEYYEQFDFNITSNENNIVAYDFANPHLQICNSYKNKLDQTGRNALEQSIPYCFSDRVSYQMDESDLVNMLESFIRYYNDKNKKLTANIPTQAYDLNKHNEKPTTKRNLQCDPFKDTNENTYSYSETEQFKISDKTKNYYKENQEAVNTKVACESICTEVLTVKYGPPKAVKAGSCFESEVIIKSSVECDSKVNFPPPTTPKKSEVKIPNPVCKHGGIWAGQAGPSDEFDQCIQDCDGGEYSQKCIDKCYDNTEDISNNKSSINDVTLSFNSTNKTKNNILQVANSSCPNPKDYSDINKLVDAVWNYMHEDGNLKLHGKFTKNPVKWNAETNCRWDKYSPWYFLNKDRTSRTVKSDMTVRNKFKTQCWGIDCYGYYPDSYGFKRQGTNGGCSESCRYSGYNDTTFNNTTNVSDADYTTALKNYNDTISKCKTNSTCTNTTSSFTISVANENNKSGVNNPTSTNGKIVQICGSNDNLDSNQFKSTSCFSWKSSINYNNKLGSPSGNLNMLKDLDSQCSGSDNRKDHYYTHISFPGDWIKNKGGTVTHTEPKDITFYKKHDNQYCIDRDFGNINADWWTWSEKYGKDESMKKIVNKNSLFYNILDTISNFGYFKWNFDVSCFFAAKDNPGKCIQGESNCPDTDTCPPTGDCGKVRIDEFKTRAASLNNLFVSPNKKMSLQYNNKNKKEGMFKVADSTINNNLHADRITGYNWSNLATNLSILNYTIAPPAAIAMIQDMGDDVYKRDEELDYSISLTPTQMRRIRDYNKTTDSYLSGGQTAYNSNQNLMTNSKDYQEIDGVLFYKSSFIRSAYFATLNHKPARYGCNNLKNGVCNKDYNGYARQPEVIPGMFNNKGQNVLSSQRAFR